MDIHTVSTIIGIAVGAGIKHAWDTHWRLKAALKQPNAPIPSPVVPRPSVAVTLAAQVEAIRAREALKAPAVVEAPAIVEPSPVSKTIASSVAAQDMIMPGLPRVHQ
jgi:hypothetical protein